MTADQLYSQLGIDRAASPPGKPTPRNILVRCLGQILCEESNASTAKAASTQDAAARLDLTESSATMVHSEPHLLEM